jgi:EpsI family protein
MDRRSFVVAAVVLSLTLLGVFKVATRGVPVVLHTNLENLPMQIAEYQGREDYFAKSIYEELQADRHVYRHYQSPEGQKVDLYIGYYGTAKGGRTGHNPFACLPGAGWGIVENGTIVLKPSYYPQGISVNYVVSRKGDTYNVMLHWYQSARTKVLVTGLQQNLQRFTGRVLHNRNDGAFVQVSALAAEQELSLTKERVTAFALETLELLPNYWPVEG